MPSIGDEAEAYADGANLVIALRKWVELVGDIAATAAEHGDDHREVIRHAVSLLRLTANELQQNLDALD